ncbi:hypothetical protein HC891_24055 [Candidatus Gracilibacteria bacterium]|nr:hypothetical protein [Candidatus Gracilibacteria bacterium]
MSYLSASSTDLTSLLAGLGPADLALLAPLRACLESEQERVSSALAVFVEQLEASARLVLDKVQAHGGSYPAALLEAEFGLLRPCSAYSSPRAYLRSLRPPQSPLEQLFIAGLLWPVATAEQRWYRIPTDVLAALPPVAAHDPRLRSDCVSVPARLQLADFQRLERQAVVLLDIARLGKLVLVRGGVLSSVSIAHIAQLWGKSEHSELQRSEAELLRFALVRLGVLRVASNGQIRPTRAAVEWLARPRLERLKRLLECWAASEWDALRHLLGFQLHADTPRDLTDTRRVVLAMLAQAPAECWLSVETFCEEMRRLRPAFARPDGDFDSWRLRDRLGRSRDGFTHWSAVEGALLRATLECDLRWLGLCDSGYDAAGRLHAFRLTPLAAALLNGEVAQLPPERPIFVQANFQIAIPPDAAPLARFQVARIAERVSAQVEAGMVVYRLTRSCVEAELDRGAHIDAILAMLHEAAADELPPNVSYSLREWGARHGRLRLRRVTLLHADDPLLIARLRRDRRLRLRDAEALGETSLALPEAQASTIAARLRKAGYGLAEELHAGDAPFSARELIRLAAALQTVQRQTGDLAGAALLERLLGMLTDEQRAAVDELVLMLTGTAAEEDASALHLSE